MISTASTLPPDANASPIRSSQGPSQSNQRIDSTDINLNGLRELTVGSLLVSRAMVLPSMQGRNQMYVHQLVEEYLKFLVLKATAKDTNARHLSPSGEVDEIWHLHLLDTQNYKACCEFLNVGFIHHNPHGVNEGLQQEVRLSNTRTLYQQTFGYRPHFEFWGADQDNYYHLPQPVVLEEGIQLLYFQCGHIDCRCQPRPFHLVFQYEISNEEYNSLYWSDHNIECRDRAQNASDALTASVLQFIGESADGGEAMSDFFQGKTQGQDKAFFLRDRLPKTRCSTCYLLEECPNHSIPTNGGIVVHVKMLTGKSVPLRVLPTFTLLHLKMMLQSKTGHLIDAQRLVFVGNQLEDDRAVSDYGIRESSTIHMIPRLRGC